ncbi:MAG: gliding motility-associated ABC transporter substrate-binding protein GldG [Bacteroidales bacterium]|nr:gliding motility-associated ABC transporter substrate-binding protein GldG [Bacteroidales bacterium]
MKKRDIRQCVLWVGGIALLALVSSRYFFRIDLTAEKRYTLSHETRRILRNLDAPLHLNVYLEGDLPPGFRKLRTGIREMLDEFKTYAGHRLICHFFDPAGDVKPDERDQFYAELNETGLRSVTVNRKNRDGSLSQQQLFPGAIITYKDRMSAVNLLNNNRVQSSDVVLNASLESLEYELIRTIYALSSDTIGKVAFITGHGEPGRAETYDLGLEYANFYDVERKTINGRLDVLDSYKAVIITRPTTPFDEKDKYVIDRYIMRGGKVLWLLDGIDAHTDSLYASGFTFALASQLNLEDQLFTYGVRVNPQLVQDIVNNPIVVTLSDGTSQPTPAPWLYHPLVQPSPHSMITRRLNPIWLRYAGHIDTVGTDSGIRKTVLLQTSPFARISATPCMIRLDEVEKPIERQHFNRSLIVGVLLEGQFPSLFRSRSVRHLFPEIDEKPLQKGKHTKMIVVSDGDIAVNDVRQTPQGAVPAQPLGHDRYSRQTFGNKDFLVNALNYLTDDAGLMKLRNREFQLRMLDKQKLNDGLTRWQLINVLLPILLWAGGGMICGIWRKRKYGRPRRPVMVKQ